MGKQIYDRFWFGYCCTGHDGYWSHRVKGERGSQRMREKRQWRNDAW